MNAVLRVWWTFFTALPLQRWLGGIGAVLCSLIVMGALVSGEDGLWIFGLLVLFILAVFPTLFAGPAVLRALSAPRANQLLPHFRIRMLGAVALFVAALLAAFAFLFWNAPSPAGGRLQLQLLGYVFAFATAMFMWMFAQCGDARWVWLWIAMPLVLGIVRLSPSSGQALLAGTPAWTWPAAAVAAWIVFAAWYVRARRIGPVVFAPQARRGAWASADLERNLTRERALRTLVTAEPPGRKTQAFVLFAALALGAVVIMVLLTPRGRLFPFTSFIWPFGAMLLLWGKATSIVHRSRLVWLRMPGPRDGVRREIERALLHNLRGAVLLLLGIAAIYASPLVGTAPTQVLAGLTAAACAALFSTYVAFASIPGRVLHLVSFALMMALQLALLGIVPAIEASKPASPSLTAVGIVAAVELGAAIALRALATQRWRHVDWLRLRPLPISSGWRGT
jgi:hypothetical protein